MAQPILWDHKLCPDLENLLIGFATQNCCSNAKLFPTFCNPVDPRLLCPTLSPRVCSNSWWRYLTISTSTSPFPFAFNLDQHQRKTDFFNETPLHIRLEPQLQHQSFLWILGLISFRIAGLILQSKGFSKVFSSTAIWKHRFFSAHPFLLSNSHIYT